MPYVSRKEAEKLTGKSRSTLVRYVRDGKLSAHKNDQGENMFEPSELERVFGPLRKVADHDTDHDDTPDLPDDAGDTRLKAQISGLENEIDALKAKLTQAERKLDTERDDAKRERERFMGMLENKDDVILRLSDQRDEAQKAAEKRSWWQRTFGKKD